MKKEKPLKKLHMEKLFMDTGSIKNLIAIIILLLLLVGNTACSQKTTSDNQEIIMTDIEKERVFKMIVDHPDLQQYLHPELEERVPLRVKSHDALGVNLSVEKFDESIVFVRATEDGIEEYLEVTAFEIEAAKITFELNYEVEGVKSDRCVRT